jgi:hypothetical protein
MATASKRSRPQSDGESDHVSLQPTNIDANHCLDDDENDSGIGQGVVESSKSPSTTPKTNISSRDIVRKSTTIVSQPLVESDDDHRSRTTTTLALSLSQLPVLNSASGGFKLFVEQTPADQLSIYEEMLNRQPNRSINSDRMPDFNFRMLKLLREEVCFIYICNDFVIILVDKNERKASQSIRDDGTKEVKTGRRKCNANM